MPGSQRQQCSFTHRHLHPPAPCRCLCGIALDLTSPASADWGLGKCTQHVGGQTPHLARLPTRLHSQGPEDTSLWGLACTPSEIHEFSVQRYRGVMMHIISFLLLIKYFVLRIQKKKKLLCVNNKTEGVYWSKSRFLYSWFFKYKHTKLQWFLGQGYSVLTWK